MRKINIVIVFTFILIASKAQPPSKFYNKYGGLGIDIGYGIKEAFDRHYIIAGTTSSFGYGAKDALLMLIDSMGQKVWEKNYGGALTDVAKKVIVNPADSGFIFTGHTNSLGNGGYDVYVVRTNKHGDIIWQKTFGGFDWDFGNDLTFAPDGNVVVCGYTYSMGYGKKDGYILKLNTISGQLIWEKYFGKNEDDEFKSIIYTTDNNFSIAGTRTNDNLTNDFWLVKLNNNGDSLISKSITSTLTNDFCYDVVEDKNNHLVFSGAFDTSFALVGKFTSYLVKTELNGDFLSEIKFYGGGLDDEKFESICVSKNKNEYCMARKIDHGVFRLDFQPFLTLDNYTYVSSTTYGDLEDEESFEVSPCSDNGFIMVGYTKSYGIHNEDIFVVKLDSTLINSNNVIGVTELPNSNKTIQCFYFNNYILFPNNNSNKFDLKIYDSSGILNFEGCFIGEAVDVHELKSGIYYAHIYTETKVTKFKFIKL